MSEVVRYAADAAEAAARDARAGRLKDARTHAEAAEAEARRVRGE